MIKRAKIITVANQKGGVGKTTTVMNLGFGLFQEGARVLLVDLDPQANLTSYCGVNPGVEPFEQLKTIDEIFLTKRPFDEKFIDGLVSKFKNKPDLISSDSHLNGVENFLFTKPDREQILERFLSAISDRYDFILIDTPPSLNLLTLNALCASQFVIIPVQPEFFSLEGIVKIKRSIQDIRERFNRDLSILGVVANQLSPRRKLTGEVLTALQDGLGSILFRTQILDSASVTESTGHAESVIQYDPKSKGALAFVELAKEVLTRCNSSESLLP